MGRGSLKLSRLKNEGNLWEELVGGQGFGVLYWDGVTWYLQRCLRESFNLWCHGGVDCSLILH
jgi:hypothetical protein